MATLNVPLNNAQLEIVQLFQSNLNDTELTELKKLLVAYKAERLARKINQVWENKGWTQDNMNDFLQTHLRTPYQSQQAFAEDTKAALLQVEAHQKGEIQLTTLEAFLEEL